jgi:hypothetical protein
MLLTPSTVSINLSTGVVTPSDPVSARRTLAITLTGTGAASSDNQKAALFRRCVNGLDGTLCATCDTFTGGVDAFVGTMSLNTQQVVAAFTDLVALKRYETLRFDLVIWDAQDAIYTVWDDLNVAYEFPLSSDTPPAVSPITSSTTIWGQLKLESGSLYLRNAETGKYNLLQARGADDGQHLDLGPGVVI